MTTYQFTLTLQGEGKNSDEAWANAVEAFTMDPGPPPTAIPDINETFARRTCKNKSVKGFKCYDLQDCPCSEYESKR